MYRKTKAMKEAEERVGATISEYLISEMPRIGITGCADRLGVSKATLGYWILKLRLRRETVLLRPGEVIYVQSSDGEQRKVALRNPIE